MHAAAANDKIRFINYLFLERNPMESWNIHEATDCLIEDIAALLNIKVTFLNAVIKRYPSLKTAQAPHRLEVCGGKNCAANGSAALLKHIRGAYGAESGGISTKGGFSFKICGCLKHCGKGPNIKWDGEIYNAATPELIKRLAGK